MGKKDQTTTSTQNQTYTPAGLSQLQDIWSRVQGVASTPYQAYTGQMVAGLTPEQTAGIQTINSASGTAQPYYNQAFNYAGQSANPIGAGDINQYLSPYTQQVVDATRANFADTNAQQQSQVLGNAAARGALGGDRVGVAQAELAKQQRLAQDPVIAGLYNTGYSQALGAAQADRAAKQQAASLFGNLGTGAQTAQIQGGTAQIGAGSVAQQNQQDQLSAAYNQYQQAQAFPYQQAQFLASLGLPTVSAFGGTQSGQSTSTQPGPSPWGQIAGAALTAASLFSDERVKENIQAIGKDFSGQNIYRYNYKGDPKTQIGYLAQEVEGSEPSAVGSVGGIKTVNYDTATSSAARKGHYASGGVVDITQTPTYIPKPIALQSAQRPQFSPMSTPKSSGKSGFESITPQSISGAFGGASNLFNGLSWANDPGPSYGGSLDPSRFGVGADSYGGGFGRGGRTGGDDFLGTVNSIRGALKSRGFASGGSVGVPASMEDRTLLNADAPLTPDRANAIYDAYMRAGGGSDVSDNQFVKNSQFGILPWSQAMSGIGGSLAGTPFSGIANLLTRGFANGGPVIDMQPGAGGIFSPSGRFGSAFDMVGATPYSVPQQPVNVTPSAGFGPTAAPALPPPTSIASMPVTAQSETPQAPPQTSGMSPFASAIGGMESGNDYSAIGPATASGDRAYGKYQVMGANIPEWTKAVIGRAMTPQEFLANKNAQDAVFNAKFGSYADKYGPEGAAKAWFAGEGGMNDPNRRDVLGTSVADYAGRFNRAIGGEGSAGPYDVAALPANAQPAQFSPDNSSPGMSFLRGIFGGKGGGLSDEARQGLLAAGLGMLASRSPFALTQIGEGGLQGLSAYSQAKKSSQERGMSQQRIDLQAKQLADQAERFSKEFGLKQQQYNLTQMQPVKVGTDVMGRDIYAQRDPKTGQYINLQTGKPITEGGGSSPFKKQPDAGVVTAPQSAGPQGGDEGAIPQAARPTSSERPQVNTGLLEQLEPQIALQVKALSEGRMAFPSGFALKSPYWQTMISLVSQYDPSFDAVNYNGRAKARNDFTSGKSAQNITSFNTAIGHLDSLDKSVDELENSRFPWWNSMANSAKGQYDTKFQSAMKKFQAAKTAVTDELTRAFRGTGGNVHDIVQWEKAISDSDSPEALHSAIRTAIELLHSRIEAVGDQYNRGMGTTKDPLTLLSPKAQEAVRRLSEGERAADKAEKSAAPKPPAVGEVIDGHRFKGGNPAEKSNWEKVQ